ncbi:MAG: thiamine-phosphate pyrophosphorylase [Candidatus Omnitrophota bacterium]
MKKSVNRIIDANINRAKEGLRVCEEIARFMLDDRGLTGQLKRIRHNIDTAARHLPYSLRQFIQARDSSKDIGRDIYANELKRGGVGDIFFANIQRCKESARVLEEFSKLFSANPAKEFKKIRYAIYETEKKVIKKISALSDH